MYGQASGPVLTSQFLALVIHSAPGGSAGVEERRKKEDKRRLKRKRSRREPKVNDDECDQMCK